MGVALLLGLGATGFSAAQPQPARAATTTITSTGPLTAIGISSDLNCSVNHVGDTEPEFFEATACGTFVAFGGTLYGPSAVPAAGAAAPRTGFTPVSQSAVTGTGTIADPFVIVTVVDLGTTNIHLTQTDSYVVGQESYRTDVQLSNSGASLERVILYRAGDCFLQNSDKGFGSHDLTTGAVACVSGVLDVPSGTIVPGDRIEQWFPLSSGSHSIESLYSSVWSAIGAQGAFLDLCTCTTHQDNGAGLSWSFSIAAASTETRSHLTTFSPAGITPLTTAKTADEDTSTTGATNGYTITVTNPNDTAVTLSSITDTLPAGFSYVAGSSSGATTSNPGIVGQDLTWTGSFPVAANADTTLHFSVTVATEAGDYDNEAGGTSEAVEVDGTGPTARVTVTNPPPVVEAGGPYNGTEGDPVSLDGTVTNLPLSDTLTTVWSYVGPLGATCTFGSTSAVDTTVTCTADGSYTLTLTADDGVNPPVSDTASLTLADAQGTLREGRLWVGLRNSDDQGTPFDVKVELFRGETLLGSGLTRCVTGLTRNQALAKLVIVPYNAYGSPTLAKGDVIKISTRIGSASNGAKCTGPGTGHSSATGLRLYYDAVTRASMFDASAGNLYLHSDGGMCDKPAATTDSRGVFNRTLDTGAPAEPAPRCKDSSAIKFSGNNLFTTVGMWTVAALP